MSENGFTRHGIKHLSPSSLNMWIASPSAWVTTKLLGRNLGVGIPAHRGTATEFGVVRALKNGGLELDDAIEAALKHFGDLTAMGGYEIEEKAKARRDIEKMIRTVVPELVDLGPPDFPQNGGQHMVSINCRYGPAPNDVVPFIGYLDLLYPARKLIVDLKTTSRLPSGWSLSHAIQAALYARGSGFDVRFRYVSPTGTKEFAMEEVDRHLAMIKAQVARLERFLRVGDAETLASIAPHDPTSFYWTGSTAREIEREIFG